MGRRLEDSVWDERRDWIQRQASSGTSAARFCRENGLKLGNFQAWKRRLDGNAAVGWRMRSAEKPGSGDRRSSSFVQLPIPAVPPVTSGASWIEVSSAAGIVVRVPSGNLPALRTVLGALLVECADA